MSTAKKTTATSEAVQDGEQTRNARQAINPHQQTATIAKQYREEVLVDISISPLYADEFSRMMPVVLNGIRLNIPVDGQSYKVPESFAMEIRQRIRAVDDRTKRQKRMADIGKNFEHAPGELELFR
jgi:hypothetical protein